MYGSRVAPASTICEIVRGPTLVTRSPLEPVDTSELPRKKAKSEVYQPAKTYQLARQDVLFDFEKRTHRLGQASIVAWFRVLTFAEESLNDNGESKADRKAFTIEGTFFGDYQVNGLISEDEVNSLLYTHMDSVAAKEFVKAESRKEWHKCFFLAFGRLPNFDG